MVTLKRRTVIYGIGVCGTVGPGLVVVVAFFGLRSLEVASWFAGIVGTVATVVATVVALVLARQDTAAASRAPAATTAPVPRGGATLAGVATPAQVDLAGAAAPIHDKIGSTEPPTPDPLQDADLIGAPGLGPGDANAERQAGHVHIAAAAWSEDFKSPRVSEGLLRGTPARDLSQALAPLDEFLERSLPKITVEIHTAHRSRNVPADTVARFWTVMLVDSILQDGGVGIQRWLVRETDTILRKDRSAVPRLREVWQWMFDTYLSSTADQPETGLMQTLVTEAITRSGDDHKRLYPNVDFLIGIARDDPPTLRRIRDVLKEHDDVLRERGSSPATLRRVQLLLGRLGAASGPAPFNPDLVAFPAHATWPYPFQAMCLPLTVGDVNGILRRPGGAEPAMPYGLPQDRADGTAFAGMWRELSDILGSLPRPADGDDWRWDIPTVAEWITLADCVDQPYPWGRTPPTRLHANLKFEPDSRLSPVGTYVAGKSKGGVYDCCGGLHEIVYELPHERFDTDPHFEGAFRLAGGSYLSPPDGVTGQRFRHLSPRDRGDRPSCVGIRLIAYRERDEALRWEALRAYRLGRQNRS